METIDWGGSCTTKERKLVGGIGAGGSSSNLCTASDNCQINHQETNDQFSLQIANNSVFVEIV